LGKAENEKAGEGKKATIKPVQERWTGKRKGQSGIYGRGKGNGRGDRSFSVGMGGGCQKGGWLSRRSQARCRTCRRITRHGQAPDSKSPKERRIAESQAYDKVSGFWEGPGSRSHLSGIKARGQRKTTEMRKEMDRNSLVQRKKKSRKRSSQLIGQRIAARKALNAAIRGRVMDMPRGR